MKLPLWINSCRVEERSVRLVYKTKMVRLAENAQHLTKLVCNRGSISPTGEVQDYVGIAIEDA